jgi:DNA invertase Pin-like site-specific DNA recombinase
MESTVRAIGYCRVSTQEQADSKLGLGAQREAIDREITYRRYKLVDVVEDAGESGKDLHRPGISSVLERLARGEADALVVAKLDRLTRSVLDLAELVDWAKRAHVRLIFGDLGVDTASSGGKMFTQMLGVFAEFERDRISERTREAAAVRREQRKCMGRPGVLDTDRALADRIKAWHADGWSLRKIADQLNTEGVPTVRGAAQWHVSAVQAVTGYRRPPAKPRRAELPEPARRRRRAA